MKTFFHFSFTLNVSISICWKKSVRLTAFSGLSLSPLLKSPSISVFMSASTSHVRFWFRCLHIAELCQLSAKLWKNLPIKEIVYSRCSFRDIKTLLAWFCRHLTFFWCAGTGINNLAWKCGKGYLKQKDKQLTTSYFVTLYVVFLHHVHIFSAWIFWLLQTAKVKSCSQVKETRSIWVCI